MLMWFQGFQKSCVSLSASHLQKLPVGHHVAVGSGWQNAGTLHIGEGWQESCQLPLGKSIVCAPSLPKPLAVLGQCFVLPISTASGLGNLVWRDGVLKWTVWGEAPLCAPLVPPTAVPLFLCKP